MADKQVMQIAVSREAHKKALRLKKLLEEKTPGATFSIGSATEKALDEILKVLEESK